MQISRIHVSARTYDLVDALAVDVEADQAVVQAVLEVCQGGELQGRHVGFGPSIAAVLDVLLEFDPSASGR